MPDTGLVEKALLSEVDSPGGCAALIRVVPLPTKHFPGVDLWYGECWSEHGSMLRPVVGRDPRGQVLQLGSPVGLSYLFKIAKPTLTGTGPDPEYVRLIMILQGEWPSTVRLIQTLDDIPPQVRMSMPWIKDSVSSSRLPTGANAGGRYTLLGISDSTLYEVVADLDSVTGAVDLLQSETWPHRRPEPSD